ncbi:hypothetical protein [Nonomuraea sp. NPDC050783]|uniref:hypothetical protein n=1 Tax=Nonomuraea sp. NPDC050783 TaxID=3154634 RepID=UPI0034650B32
MSTPDPKQSTTTTPSSTTKTPAPTATPTATALDGPTPKDLLPASGEHPVEIVRYQTVVLTDIPGAKTKRKLTGAIDLGEEDLPFYDRPAEGMIVTTEQKWAVEGVTLGRLLHSLPLAPGESTKVAVIDWERRTVGTGTEKTSEKDELTNQTLQERSISELANSIAREEQHGSSQMSQFSVSESKGGSGGFSFFGITAGGSASKSTNVGFATSVGRSTGVRSVAAEAAQRINARTQQLATAARSRHMTVVRETSQSEKEQVMTRVVTNYNHMHALSVQYYEVVQVYKVTTKPARIERCLFIPLEDLNFTPSSFQRYKEVLAAVAPADWAKLIRETKLVRATARKLNGYTAVSAPEKQTFEDVKLIDLATSSMGVYGIRKSDGAPVRFDPAVQRWYALPTTGLSGGLKCIAPGKGQIWGILQSDERVVVYDGTTWKYDPSGASARKIACGADGTPYLVGTNGMIYQRGTGWQDMQVEADDLAVLGRDRLWYCRHGKIYERTGNTWTERMPNAGGSSSLAVTGLAAAPDGIIWVLAQFQSTTPGQSPGQPSRQFLVTFEPDPQTGTPTGAQVKSGPFSLTELPKTVPPPDKLLDVLPVGNGEFWLRTSTNQPLRLQTATRGTPTPYDGKSDSGAASKIDVWWDEDGIRSVTLVVSGQTFRCGDTSGSGIQQHAAYAFEAGDKLLSVDYWAGSAARGSLSGLRLTMQSRVLEFGSAVGSTAIPDLTEDAGGALCGLHGSTVTTGSRTYIASLGFHVRGDQVPQLILDHLNDNRRHYSQAIWSSLDELTLSRILANYTYTPPGGKDSLVPLGAQLDPKPVAVTGNYLGFRWNFATEQEREDWVKARRQDSTELGKELTSVVGIATNGVFAEAVLGRANSAEKIDLTRFWNWKESPIPILPTDIAPVATGGRSREVDVKVTPLAPTEARFQTIQALPNPTGMDATLQTVAAANLFRDMSGMAEIGKVLTKGMELAAGNDQAAAQRAGEAMKTAAEHMQKMAQIALEAVSKAVPAGQAAGSLSALGGMLNQSKNGAGGDKE